MMPRAPLHEQPAPQQEVLPDELLYREIAQAEDPRALFAEIADDPERVMAVLGAAEHDVALAGSEVERGMRTNDEVRSLERAVTSYGTILHLVVEQSMRNRLQEDGVSEERAKHDAVDMMRASSERILAQDYEYRTEGSMVERAKEAMSATRTRRILGRIMLGAAVAGGMYAAYRVQGAESVAEVINDFENTTETVTLAGALAATKYAGEFIHARSQDELSEYEAETDNQGEMVYAKHQTTLEHIDAALHVVAGNAFLEEGYDISSLISELIEKQHDLLTAYYNVEAQPEGERRQRVADILATKILPLALEVLGVNKTIASGAERTAASTVKHA